MSSRFQVPGFRFLQSIFGGWRKAVGGAAMRFAPKWKRWEFEAISFQKLAAEGYRINSAVSACVTTLAFSFPEPPLLAGSEEDGRFVPNYKHPLMKLIRQPNPDMGEAELMQFAITYASVGGNCYLWKQRRMNGSVMALWPFSDGQITPIPGETTADGFVKAYEYDAGDGQKITLPKQDIIQWKWMIDPLRPARGIGAVELSAREVDKDSEATAYIYSLLKNNGVPPVIITMADGDEFTDEKAERLRTQWNQRYARGELRGGPAFIEYGMKAEAMGFDLQKLAADALTDVSETRIAANFHVPPSVAGLNVGVKRSDYGDTAARKAFTEQTLMALWRSLASELLNGLRDDFGLTEEFRLQFDVRNVGALQELKKDQRTSVNELWKSGLILRSEAKKELGMKPLPGDDVYFVSLASEFVPAGESVQRSAISDQQSAISDEQEAEGDPTPDPSPNSGKTPRFGEGKKIRGTGDVLLRIRNDAARQMTQAVDVYFSQLADRVVERAGKATPPPAPPQMAPDGRNLEKGGKGKLPGAGDLFEADDWDKLETLIKRFYVLVLELSWNTWNVSLGVELAFDLADPAVTRVLGMAGLHVREIKATILDEVRKALQYGSENGWSIDMLVRGDEAQRGLRDIIDETYKNQARAIARAELGQAQNVATAERYREAGLTKVEILDGGAEDSAPACDQANGMIWTVDLFERHPLQHPNCSRAAAPYFGDEEPVTSWPYAFGQRG